MHKKTITILLIKGIHAVKLIISLPMALSCQLQDTNRQQKVKLRQYR